jgi:hypothetical protein
MRKPSKETPEPGSGLSRAGGIILRLVVLFHVFAITSWSLPKTPPGIANGSIQFNFPSSLRNWSDWLLYVNERYVSKKIAPEPQTYASRPIQTYLLFTGTWQYWDMFAPNPSNWDGFVTADIFFADGTMREHQYPRINILPLHEKYVKERYRKFLERAHPDDYAWIRPYFAQRIALENYKDPENPPVLVVLHRHWRLMPRPPTLLEYWANLRGTGNVQLPGSKWMPTPPERPDFTDSVYYNHEVDQAHLRSYGPL